MEEISVAGLRLFFDAEEREAAELIQAACERSVQHLQQAWGLAIPGDCRVYVMTSWQGFLLRAAPWHWRLALAATRPLWAKRVANTWALAGGWEQSFGRRRAVGVKPPRLIVSADSSLGDQIFIREVDVNRKVQSVTCHELTHAFTAHLRLPAWLKEGLAMVAVDRYWETATVRPDTLARLERAPGQARLPQGRRLSVENPEALIHLYVRGYWLTRYLAETRPDVLTSILARRRPPEELDSGLAAALGQAPDASWPIIDRALAAHFRRGGLHDDE